MLEYKKILERQIATSAFEVKAIRFGIRRRIIING